jgi:transcription elongation factor GreA
MMRIYKQYIIDNTMRTPIRKPGKYTGFKPDEHITEKKYLELKAKLEKLIKFSRPQVAKEMQIHAQDGDFSENAPYQAAKGRLRGINQRILDIEDHLKRAVIINPQNSTDCVRLGSSVTVEISGPVLSAAEGPVLSAAEGPVLSAAEGPVLSAAEGPVLSAAEGKTKTYLILGSSETDPAKNVISHNSPLGMALMGHKIGDSFKFKKKNGEVKHTIIRIE